MLENNNEFIIKDNFFFSSNLKYSLADNFDDLEYPPVNTYPAQVRSDIKDYLKNFGDGVFIGRAQFDYHLSPKQNHHIMATFGILEEMFNGYGFEYLYFEQDSNYAIGFEIFDVKKRDYEMRFGTLDYENVTGILVFIIETIILSHLIQRFLTVNISLAMRELLLIYQGLFQTEQSLEFLLHLQMYQHHNLVKVLSIKAYTLIYLFLVT